MRIVTFDEETTLDELLSRLFGKQSKKKLAALTERLLQANPHLRDTKTILPRTPIVVPEDEPDDARLTAAVERVDAALQQAGTAEQARLEQQRDELLETMRFARTVRAGIEPEDRDALEQLSDIDATAAKGLDELDQRLAELPRRIDGLRKLAREAVPRSEELAAGS